MITRFSCLKCKDQFMTSMIATACPACGGKVIKVPSPFEAEISRIEIESIEEESDFEQMLEVDSKITNLFLEIAEQYGNDMFQFALDRVKQIEEYKNGGD